MGDPPLSSVGLEQARATAKFFSSKNISAIFSSPLLRTKQTAEIMAQNLGLEVSLDERLKERMNWGDKDNESFQQFLDEWDRSSKNRKYQPYHGDSSFNTGERVKQVLLDADNKYPGKEILIVTHGGAIGDFLLNTFNDLELTTSPTGITYVKLWECSVTTIVKEKDTFLLREVGNTSHLPEPLI